MEDSELQIPSWGKDVKQYIVEEFYFQYSAFLYNNTFDIIIKSE